MATAVKSIAESTPKPQAHLLRASLVGALYVVVSYVVAYFLLPVVGHMVADVLGGGVGFYLRMLVDYSEVVAFAGLLILGAQLGKRSGSPAGHRAGAFLIVAFGLLLFLVTIWIGRILEGQVFDPTNRVGLALMIGIGAAIGFFAVRYALSGSIEHYFIAIEQQGWFHWRNYKGSQGKLVRRLTMLGILLVIGTGVAHLALSGDWKVRIPFTLNLLQPDSRLVAILMPSIRWTVPATLAVGGLWLAWRAVNFPAFADFLIATEAELNKVSWTSRKRLIQDTVVVLVTLVLFTVFLLVVDQLWGWLLTRETLGGIIPKPVPQKSKDAKDISW